MKCSEQPGLVALIHGLNEKLEREHGFKIAEPHESIKTNEGEVFEFALLAARNEKGQRPLVPFRFKACETFGTHEATAFVTLVTMTADILTRFIAENAIASVT